MFAPDERSVLREALRPDPGEALVHAVGTTFTLDLAAALAVPLAFASRALSSSADPIAVLEAVRSASDSIDVFCQCGMMRAPRSSNDLVAFLEPMVHEVRAPQSSAGALFHPKVWVARYSHEEGERFRLLCATRNLTDSASWDAMVRLDGKANGRRTNAGNRPLMDLLRALPGMAVRQLEPDRQMRINELAEALGPVEWEMPPDLGYVTTFGFHALGLRRVRGKGSLVESLSGRRHLIVSPFLSDHGLANIVEGSSGAIVISSAESLERLEPSTLDRLTCKVISPRAGLSIDDEDEGDQVQGVLGGLHAKVYVVERGKQAALLVGSANATDSGLLDHNVEFMIEFVGGPKAMGIDLVLNAEGGLGSLLEDYQPEGGREVPEAELLERRLDGVLRHVAGGIFTATVTPSGETFVETLRADIPIDLDLTDVSLTVGVYGVQGVRRVIAAGTSESVFEALDITQISAFVVVTAAIGTGPGRIERSALVRAELRGDPSTRRDEILAKQFSTTEQFQRFLALLLGLEVSSFGLGGNGVGDQSAWQFGNRSAGLFESLVNAVALRPEAIDDLERLVARLEKTERGRKILPEGFAQLWTAISGARRQHKARH